MSLIIGLDAGGTYTDAVIIDNQTKKIISTAKSLTTYNDLVLGLNNALNKALKSTPPEFKNKIELVVLSSTLATNAVVNNIGEIISLVLIGYEKNILLNKEIQKVTQGNFVNLIKGGHNAEGKEVERLDLLELEKIIKNQPSEISAYALTSQFAVRNAYHEIEARELIKKISNLPVTCSYELSSNLNGPKRAVTCVLNAKIIGIINNLIKNVEKMLFENKIFSKLMIVKGDGSLINTKIAKLKPVETIMSGPAASTIGASWLTNINNAIVSDIGGTTTDISLLNFGSPDIKTNGSMIGEWQTMVEALNIQTNGLGGDSEVSINIKNNIYPIKVGPSRAVPLSLLACQYPKILKDLKLQNMHPIANSTFGRFVWLKSNIKSPKWLRPIEKKIWNKLNFDTPVPLSELAPNQSMLGAVNRLIKYNLLGYAAFTPTDANHILNKYKDFNSEAAILGANLLLKNKTFLGNRIAGDIRQISKKIFNDIIFESALKIFEFVIKYESDNLPDYSITQNPLIKNSLKNDHIKLSEINLKINLPIIALGASAKTFYKHIGKKLSTKVIFPKYYNVAGAIGAAIGSVKQNAKVLITSPEKGIYIVHSSETYKKYLNLTEAKKQAIKDAKTIAKNRCIDAGARNIKLSSKQIQKQIKINNNENLFIECLIVANGIGTPIK